MNGYALAMLVLCIATVLQIIINARWSYRNRKECAEDRAELERLRKEHRERLSKRADAHEALGLTRELLELQGRVDRIEIKLRSSIGLALSPSPDWREAIEPAPATSPSPGATANGSDTG
jgi:hypothetical protein